MQERGECAREREREEDKPERVPLLWRPYMCQLRTPSFPSTVALRTLGGLTDGFTHGSLVSGRCVPGKRKSCRVSNYDNAHTRGTVSLLLCCRGQRDVAGRTPGVDPNAGIIEVACSPREGRDAFSCSQQRSSSGWMTQELLSRFSD